MHPLPSPSPSAFTPDETTGATRSALALLSYYILWSRHNLSGVTDQLWERGWEKRTIYQILLLFCALTRDEIDPASPRSTSRSLERDSPVVAHRRWTKPQRQHTSSNNIPQPSWPITLGQWDTHPRWRQ